jgi:hypothetical protein
MRKTVITHPDGSVTTIASRSGCGCGGMFTASLALFVVVAPAYYAGRGNWPLGWAGAVVAYIVLGVLALGALVAWAQREQATPRRG